MRLPLIGAAIVIAGAVSLAATGSSATVPDAAVRFPAGFDAAIYVGDNEVYTPATEVTTSTTTDPATTTTTALTTTVAETTTTIVPVTTTSVPVPSSTTSTTSPPSTTTTVTASTTTTTPSPPTTVAPSGQTMPTLPPRTGWDQWHQDFLTPAAEGTFLATYWTAEPRYKVNAYPPSPGTGTYNDTSTKNGKLPASVYDPNRLSVAGGVLRGRLGGPLEGGKIKVAAFLPQFYLDDRDVSAVHCVFRARADTMPSFKVAWLLWPKSNTSNPDGEVDFLEGNLGGNKTSWFMHRQALGTQDVGSIPVAMSGWQTYEFEWQRATSFWVKVNGVYVPNGAGQNVTTANVPANEMHPVFQSETRLDRTSGVTPTDTGSVYVDWLVCETKP
jgi:hypothetical protein